MPMRWRTLTAVAMMAVAACSDDDGPSEPTTGAVAIAVATSGDLPDADGYTFSIDGAASIAIGVNGAMTQTELAPGNHLVELSGLAGNCVLAGENPRTAAVTAGDTTAVAFVVTCNTPPCGIRSAVARTHGGRHAHLVADRSKMASGCLRQSLVAADA